jgi:hypothetical protein
VTEVLFDEVTGKATGVNWVQTKAHIAGARDSLSSSASAIPTVHSGTTTFTYLIDASGRAGILSTRYLKNRRYNESLKNIAVWGYWKGVLKYGGSDAVSKDMEGVQGEPYSASGREGAPWFEALAGRSASPEGDVHVNDRGNS